MSNLIELIEVYLDKVKYTKTVIQGKLIYVIMDITLKQTDPTIRDNLINVLNEFLLFESVETVDLVTTCKFIYEGCECTLSFTFIIEPLFHREARGGLFMLMKIFTSLGKRIKKD